MSPVSGVTSPVLEDGSRNLREITNELSNVLKEEVNREVKPTIFDLAVTAGYRKS